MVANGKKARAMMAERSLGLGEETGQGLFYISHLGKTSRQYHFYQPRCTPWYDLNPYCWTLTLFLVCVIRSNAVLNVPTARCVQKATVIPLRQITGHGRVVVGKGNARKKRIKKS